MDGYSELVFYSALRDALGSESMVVPCSKTLREVLESLASKHRSVEMLLKEVDWNVYGVRDDGSRVELDSRLPCGSRVHVVLPPSGGALIDARILRRGDDVDLGDLVSLAASQSRASGAVAVFVGVVKGEVGGVRVNKLVYEDAGKAAEAVMRRIALEVAEKHELDAAIVYHYTGERLPGEKTIIAVVAGKSRLNVYPALQELVDRVKREAPIWKVEYRERGEVVYILGDRVIRREVLLS